MLYRQFSGVVLAMALVAGTLGMLATLSAHVGSSSSTVETVVQAQPIQLGPFSGLDKGSARLAP